MITLYKALYEEGLDNEGWLSCSKCQLVSTERIETLVTSSFCKNCGRDLEIYNPPELTNDTAPGPHSISLKSSDRDFFLGMLDRMKVKYHNSIKEKEGDEWHAGDFTTIQDIGHSSEDERFVDVTFIWDANNNLKAIYYD